MDIFTYLMQEDEEHFWAMYCTNCGVGIWGHDLYYTTSWCNCDDEPDV